MAGRSSDRPSEAQLKAAIATYTRVHWGERGNERVTRMSAPDPYFAPAAEMGELVQVVYRTTKGGEGGEVYYHHDFEGRLPILAFNSPRGLLICGGSYRVSTRGIVG